MVRWFKSHQNGDVLFIIDILSRKYYERRVMRYMHVLIDLAVGIAASLIASLIIHAGRKIARKNDHPSDHE